MISIKSLHKYFNKGKQNEIHVINGIDLELPESGMIALFGRSGCGKTTLLNAIGGLDRTESGSVLIDGQNIRNNTDRIRNQYIGYIFQNYNLNKLESNFENVADALRLCGITDKAEIEERVMAALKNVGLDKYKSRTPDTLSGGQMQRIAIARAIVKNPKIILADEPTGNLDEANTLLIMDLLKKISENHLVILVTHEANLVDHYCDKVIELSDGKIVSVRDNESAEGFVARSKNDIYLGELEKSEAEAGGVSLEYYGSAPSEPVRLRIVNHGGKIYLSVNGENVQILDKTSEVKLREGVYTEKERAKENKASIDMSKLPPIEGSHFGRLFNFRDSFKSGYRANFKRNKKSTKALRACMFLFSLVLVFMSANLGTAFKSISDVKEKYNQSMFYVYTQSAELSKKLNDSVGQHGISNLQVQYGLPAGNGILRVSPGNFESFSSKNATFEAYSDCLDVKFIGESKTVLAGSAESLSDSEIVITSTLADRLISSASVGFLNSYESLVGLSASYESNTVATGNLRIAGVIRSDESCIYRNSFVSARTVLYNMGLSSVTVNSYDSIQINNGETVMLLRNQVESDMLPKKGKSLKINGIEFTLKDIIRAYSDYTEYLKDTGSTLIKNGSFISEDDYYKEKVKTLNPSAVEGTEDFNLLCEQYKNADPTEYYRDLYKNFDEYLEYTHFVNPDIYSYLYFEKELKGIKYYVIGHIFGAYDTAQFLYYAETYKSQNGSYPSLDTIEVNRDKILSSYDTLCMTMKGYSEQYSEEFYKTFNSFDYSGNKLLLTLSDYTALADYVGESDKAVASYTSFDFKYDYASPMLYTAIHSTAPAETELFLQKELANANAPEYIKVLYTPDSIFDDMMSEFKSGVAAKFIVLTVFLAVMSLCMYFIMRSSLMSRIKEVGIYRAIGVSKRNLTFRFLIEAFALTTLTVFIGYLISSAALFMLSTSISLLETVLYYPLWLALALLAMIYAVCLVCGILPILGLLRKTPSEILSKYDI